MVNKRVLTNKNFAWFFAPATGVANIQAITATEAATFINVSDAIKLDGTTLNTKASASNADRSFADASGAVTAGVGDFGGAISGFKAQDSDTASSFRQAETGIKPAGLDIILLARPVAPSSQALAAGDEYNAWHVLTDAPSDVRGASSYAWLTELLPQSDLGVRGIIAPAAAVAPVVTVAGGALSGAVGTITKLKAVYQGVIVTVGATWTSADPTKVTVSPHGIVERIASGSVAVTCSVPGSLPSTATTIVVV